MRFSFAHLLLTLGFLPVAQLFAVPGDGGLPGSAVAPDMASAQQAAAAAAAQGAVPYAPPGSRPPAAERSQQGAPQGATYPYVYRQVGYLATLGPVPMRFGNPTPSANERTPPRVPVANKRPELSRLAESMAGTEAIEAYRSVHGRMVPVPEGAVPGGQTPRSPFSEQGGISTGSNEVLEFFQQPLPDADVQKRQSRFLFDPVPPFSSALPPANGAQPQSRATYQKN